MRLSILLPTLNERDGVGRTIESIPRKALQAQGHEVEVLVIDGASTDGTVEEALKAGAEVVDEPRKGYGRAYKTGFDLARGDLVVTADADGSYPLDRLVEYLDLVRKEGYDFVTLNRFSHMEEGSMSMKHRFGNTILSMATRGLYGVKIKDSQSGMWFLSRKALQRLSYKSLSDGMAFSQELKIEAFRDRSLKCAELPGRYAPRIGEAKLGSWRDGTRNLARLFTGRFAPRREP